MESLDFTACEFATLIDCMSRSSRPTWINATDIDSSLIKFEAAQETNKPVELTSGELDAVFHCVDTLPRVHQIANREAYESALLKVRNARAEDHHPPRNQPK